MKLYNLLILDLIYLITIKINALTASKYMYDVIDVGASCFRCLIDCINLNDF